MSLDLTAIEPEIAARLADQLPAGTHVKTESPIPDLQRGMLATPAVYLVYDGGPVSDAEALDYQETAIPQAWICFCVVQNIGDSSGAGARRTVGPLAGAVYEALNNWTPPSAREPLRLTGLPRPGFVTGYLTFPLQFSTLLSLS